MRLKQTFWAVTALVAAPWAMASDATTQLLRQPTISPQHVAFVHGGDLWVAQRDGSQPRRLTHHAASEFAPRFSPDGRHLAFSASYDGNTDVYVMPVEGGEARRLTWHPGADVVSGWSADGKAVLFASSREVLNSRSAQLYEVPLTGGFERKVMEAVAVEGRWSADGQRLAYRPTRAAHFPTAGWRQHRGGSTPPVWIIEPSTGRWSSVPHVNASDISPVWVGDEVVFISDRDGEAQGGAKGAANLWAYHTKTQTLRPLTRETVWDVKSVDAQGHTLIYEVGGRLKTLDLASGREAEWPVRLPVEAPREQWKDAGRALEDAHLSASGKRLLVSARGEVFTLPIKDGSPRNLTQTSGVREKDALWSPDGQRIAYLSDAPGRRHQLVLRSQTGEGAAQTVALPADDYFSLVEWSPDGQRLLLQDQRLNLYALQLPAGTLTRLATNPRRGNFGAVFSPDSRWVAYTLTGANHLGRIYLHELTSHQVHAVSDPLVHAESPVFSRKGDLLFFSASTNAGPTRVGLDMSTQERPLRAGLFSAVLAADGSSPLLPKAGDEEAPKPEAKKDEPKKEEGKKDDAKKADAKPDSKSIRIDVAGLAQRIVALPVAERDNEALAVAHDGALWFLDRRQPGISREAGEAPPSADLYRFDFEEKKAKLVRGGVEGFELSPDGKKLLIRAGRGRLEIADANDKAGDAKAIDLSGLRARIDPRAEWRQIFDEVWWMEKAFFYDPALHGIDWAAIRERYLPLLEHVRRREDLNELLIDMVGELQVGHNYLSGGDLHREAPVPVGLLGADFRFENGRWRIAKVHSGDAWNPQLKAPLAVPGQAAREGEYLLAVNAVELSGTRNLYQLLEQQVGQQVTLTVATDPEGKNSRKIVVQPIANEGALRQWTWVEQNRQRVEQASGGRVGYVYLPDTAGGGFSQFNRQFFGQSDKQALIVDDRKNNGGQAANYVIELLNRPYLGGWKDRDGLPFHTPGAFLDGPKAMLIDQDAGSGGDFLPYAFKRTGQGPLIGTRTWGGLIGISANPPLIDGGSLAVPFFRFYTPEGEWRIENEGVAPDIEVQLDPAGVNTGRDSQLEAAIANVLERLKTWKPQRRNTPPAPFKLKP